MLVMKYKSLLIPLFVIPFISCETENTEQTEINTVDNTPSAIQAPFDGVQAKIQTYEVDAEKGGTITLPNGGSIDVPTEAFVDENGNAIQGTVKISLQEFHSMADILSSGIPMDYDSAGVTTPFISGGMFTINGTHEGKNVEVKKDKSLDVNLASYDDTPCYNFYKLDEKSGEWSYKDTKSGTPNPSFSGPNKPTIPEETGSDELVLDINIDNKKASSEFLKDVLWKYDGSSEAELKKFLQKHQNLRGNIVKSNRSYFGYNLLVYKGKTLDTIPVAPVFDETNLSAAMAQFKKDQANFIAAFEKEDQIPQGSMIRSISIPSFGTYNWDYIRKQDDFEPVFVQFNFNERIPAGGKAYFVSKSDRAMIALGDPTKKNEVFVKKGGYNSIIICLPDNEVAIINSSEFKKAYEQKNGNTMVLNPSKNKEKIDSQLQLEQLIARI